MFRAKPQVTLERGKQSSAVSEEIAELVRLGWAAKQIMDARAGELKGINDRLVAACGVGAKLRLAGECHAALGERVSWSVADETRLRGLLGARWDDLVIATYRPEPRLIEIAAGDDEVGRAVALTLARSVSTPFVTWRASRK